MRLFTGIHLPSTVAQRLDGLVRQLRPHAAIRWSKVQNLHITTKFIGEWPEGRLDELKSELSAIPARPPIPISLNGLGWFPNPHQPRIFWVAVRAPEDLARLAEETEAVSARLGIAPEDRPYRPHLTLARIQPPAPELGGLRRAIAALPEADFGSFEAREFHLYLSETGDGGSRYSQLASFPFTRS